MHNKSATNARAYYKEIADEILKDNVLLLTNPTQM
jgi:hypothetical protein